MSSLHTVKVLISAYDQSNQPFSGYATAKLGVPITSTDTLNEYVTQLQVQRANFADGNCVLELIPSTLLSDDSYYVFQIVRNTPETVLLEAAAVVPDEDCIFSDLVDISEYNLTIGGLTTDGINLKASDKHKVNKLINEIRLAKVAFNESSEALIAKTSEIANIEENITNIQESIPPIITRIESLESSLTTINNKFSTSYSFITNSEISELFVDVPQTSEYFSYYLFIASGQSNASGSGNQGKTRGYMQSSYGLSYDWSSSSDTYDHFIPMKDPNYPGSGDSAWPAFCNRFYELTGKIPIILNIASSGAAVTTFAGTTTTNSWAQDGVGTLRTSREPVIANCLRRLKIDGLQAKIGGILWCQGCSEGGRIANGYVTAAQYKEATRDVWNWTRNVAGIYDLPVFLSQIGWASGCFTGSNAATVHAGYEAVQNAQIELCSNLDNVFLGFDQAKNFYDPENYRMDSSGIHYTQEGYTEMGEALADAVIRVLSIDLLETEQEGS